MKQGALFNPPPVLSLPESRAARDAGIAQVERHAPDEFKAAAAAAIYRTAQEMDEFQIDDVWKYMIDSPRAIDNRAMGAAIVTARKLGWVTHAGRFASSAQKQCHAGPRSVWRSLLRTA